MAGCGLAGRAPLTSLNPSPSVASVCREIAAAGAFVLDLEFVSESRYIPELALVQLGWGNVETPEVIAFDPLEEDLSAVWELIASDQVATVLHAGQGDLALLAYRHGVRARAVWDTQIAAAFAGFRPQMGYAALVAELTGVVLDKTQQFTRWLDRPLSPEQMSYALDDVRYLPRVWQELERRLRELGRLAWVEEESERLAAQVVRRPPPEETYRRINGWERLRPTSAGALRQLAAWREEEALRTNKPPSWILKDATLVEIAKQLPVTREALTELKLQGAPQIERHKGTLLAAVRHGRAEPLPPPAEQRLRGADKELAGKLLALVQERAREAGLAASHLVAGRDDVEALVRGVQRGTLPELPVLQGWRRDFVGDALLDLLAVGPAQAKLF